MPKLDGILETAIHTKDMVRSRVFYEGVLGLAPIYSDDRLTAYAVAGRDVLLVLRKGATGQTVTLPSGRVRPWRWQMPHAMHHPRHGREWCRWGG
jgi:catechol 2,3-dioxygenase-like lactoylglutathione lyase family enzyme